MNKIRAVGDRLLEMMVPRSSAQAADCGYNSKCIDGNTYRAWCCYNPNGSGSCGHYNFYKSGC